MELNTTSLPIPQDLVTPSKPSSPAAHANGVVRDVALRLFEKNYATRFIVERAQQWVAQEQRSAINAPVRGAGKPVLGVGIVGLNRGIAFIDYCRQIRDAEVKAVCDVAAGLPQEVAKRYSVPRGYESYEAMLDDPTIDLIIVETGPPSQAEMSLRALQAGKHVLFETPGALTLEDCFAVVEQSEASGLLAGMACQLPFFHHIEAVKHLVLENYLGQVMYAECEYEFLYDIDRSYGFNRWEYNEARAQQLGILPHRGQRIRYETLASGGVCALESVLWCLGHERLVEVQAVGLDRMAQGRGHDHHEGLVAIFRTESGIAVKLTVGHGFRRPHLNYFSIYGDRGSYEGNRLDECRPGYLHLTHAFLNQKMGSPGGWFEMPVYGRGENPKAPSPEVCTVADFIWAIQAGRRPVVDARISAHLAASMICAEEAASSRKAVKIPSFRA